MVSDHSDPYGHKPLLDEIERLSEQKSGLIVEFHEARSEADRLREKRSEAVHELARVIEERDAARAEVERVSRELHQVHLNYHHMVDVAQRLRGLLSQTAHDLGEEGYAKWSSDLHRAIHGALDEGQA